MHPSSQITIEDEGLNRHGSSALGAVGALVIAQALAFRNPLDKLSYNNVYVISTELEQLHIFDQKTLTRISWQVAEG